MIAWNFPSNNDGEVTGLNNAGIETFLGEPILSLAREVNQNSLDAADHLSSRPVEVHFRLDEADADRFPDRKKFKAVLTSCRDFWHENKKAKVFFDRALEVLEAPQINVLKISDYYTTGLRGSDRIKGSDWANLIKAVGSSDKEGGAGGSFGIGKHAPFACTPLRTVFYSTLDIDGNFAMQGVSKLVTHVNADGQHTQGTGYYGKSSKNEPIRVVEEIPEFFRRTRVGTDLFVFGFEGGEDWETKIIRSVLENFFVAINERKLIVAVGDTRLDDTTLPDLMQEHFGHGGANSDCAKYYEAFTSDESKFYSLENFEGLGKVELYILPGHKFPKRVAMVRKTGMLVFYKGHFQTPLKFAGVMHATGKKINELLRSLEPPSHNKWEVERHEDPAYARRIVRQLNAWIRDCVKKISQEGCEETEYDFEGMQQYLPDDIEEDSANPSDSDGLKDAPQEVELVIRKSKKASQPATHRTSQESGGDEGGGNATTEPENYKGGDSASSEGGNAGDAGGGFGEGGTKSQNEGPGAPTRVDVKLKKLRAFCSDISAGEYRVLFQPEKSGEGFIQLRIIGEVEESPAPVASASFGGIPLAISKGGVIGPISFREGATQELSVILANQLHCALEVAAYENQ